VSSRALVVGFVVGIVFVFRRNFADEGVAEAAAGNASAVVAAPDFNSMGSRDDDLRRAYPGRDRL
jgi:hypothetical protein